MYTPLILISEDCSLYEESKSVHRIIICSCYAGFERIHYHRKTALHTELHIQRLCASYEILVGLFVLVLKTEILNKLRKPLILRKLNLKQLKKFTANVIVYSVVRSHLCGVLR
jgi:hypothetical protein